MQQSQSLSKELIGMAQKHAEDNGSTKRMQTLKRKMASYASHEEALAERLAALPLDLSPDPLYRHLERLQKAKREAEEELVRLGQTGSKEAAGADEYRAFLKKVVGPEFKAEWVPEYKSKLVKRLVQRIEVGKDSVKIHFFTDKNHVTNGLRGGLSPSEPLFFGVGGSSTLQNGGERWIRTTEG